MKEIRIDGVIGQGKDEISAAMIREQLPENGTDPIRVSFHTEGGSVFEGFAIHDLFAKYAGKKIAAIESTAFSIGSYIPTAFDEIEMAPNGYFMLHNPRISIEGDDEELGKTSTMIADLKTNMVNAYATRTGKTAEEIQTILKEETYFNAADAVAFGLADRITSAPIKGRAFARIESMPHGVVTALFGAGSGGDNDSKKGIPMTESTPVAATIDDIERAFPKAKADFVLKWAKAKVPMASVAAAAAEEMMKENEELKAKALAMEEELNALKAKAEGGEEDPAAEGDDEEMCRAKARAKGVKPIARGTSGRPSASARWNNAVEDSLAKCGGNKMKAVAMANKQNPGLREAFIAEVNAR